MRTNTAIAILPHSRSHSFDLSVLLVDHEPSCRGHCCSGSPVGRVVAYSTHARHLRLPTVFLVSTASESVRFLAHSLRIGVLAEGPLVESDVVRTSVLLVVAKALTPAALFAKVTCQVVLVL